MNHPTPWTIGTPSPARPLDLAIRDANGWTVAHIPDNQDHATAALLVAAPAMLDALRSIGEYATYSVEGLEDMPDDLARKFETIRLVARNAMRAALP